MIFTILFVAAVLASGSATQSANAPVDGGVRVESLSMLDTSRNRVIPVALYSAAGRPRARQNLAVISHGYGAMNTGYSFIANHLAARGYVVASIQHEIPGDAPLPTGGKPYDVRMPSWQNGARSIVFVVDELKKTRTDIDFANVVLIGHSHGGDTGMVVVRDHPALASAVISLDNRRMPFPRSAKPRILSMRSSDLPADEGVLPSAEEQATFRMRVVKLPATIHNDMWDGGTEAQKAEMLRYIGDFLQIGK